MANQGSVDHLISLSVSNTVLDVSNFPTYIATIEAANPSVAVSYLQIFWKASGSVTLGTTVPDVVIPLLGTGGAVIPFQGEGWKTRGTAWSIAATTTRTGSTAGVSPVDLVIWKKN